MKRIQNKELLKIYHEMQCVVCGTTPCDPDHIRTKGAGGHDHPQNLWALCRTHHQERHKIGIWTFVFTYPHIKDELYERGWEKFGGKWIAPSINNQ